MDKVTYPEDEVVEFLNERVVPVRVPYDQKPLAEDFQVKWTPLLVILDSEGEEHHRSTGFLAPYELIAMILLGSGKLYFHREDFTKAIQCFDELLEKYPDSGSAPESVYFRGVSGYKSTHKPEPLKEAFEVLRDKFPDSEWAKRAAPYRLL
jgi:tetratricopeptide (TPR) repeat protein